MSRVEVGASYRLARRWRLKLVYQHNWRFGRRADERGLPGRPALHLVLSVARPPVVLGLAIGIIAALAPLPPMWSTAAPAGSAIRGRVDVRLPASPVGHRPDVSSLGGRAARATSDRRRTVVYLETAPQAAFEEPRQRRARIDQRNETFVPHLLAVTVGTTVDFPNNDTTYHNVFSLSTPRPFDLGRYAAGRSKSVTFDRPGIVRVFCDIHSHMSAFILVFSHRFFAVTDDQGRYTIEDVPAGTYTVSAWNEAVKSESRSVTVGPGGSEVGLDFILGRGGAMTPLWRSLSNRIFLASAALAVLSILAALWLINRSVTAQAELDIQRGLAEAGTLVDEYRRLSLSQLAQAARLIADLPKFKAAVELDDPPTVAPLAEDYRAQLGADLIVVVGRGGRVLAREGVGGVEAPARSGPVGGDVVSGRPDISFLPGPDGILQLVTVPIWIDPSAPDVLGTLSVGVSLDSAFAARIKRLTDSDIVFAWEGRVRAGTLQPRWTETMDALLQGGRPGRVQLGEEEYDAIVRPLVAPDSADPPAPATRPGRGDPGVVVVLRSRTERLKPLRALHGALALIAVIAVLMATLLSYLVARTVTRPIRAIAATMRDMASSGDLTRRALAPSTRWDDEDARVLAATFNAMTGSISRFQREAAQRERLSSLGRLSTVVAHEIRNPLMIIKAALRTLRRSEFADADTSAAVADVDEEVRRLNALVNEVLDYARPIKFAVAPASLSAVCSEAMAASGADGGGASCDLRLGPEADAIVTDSERLRQALINVLANARQAVASRPLPSGAGGPPWMAASPDIELATRATADGRVRITVRDRGPGIDAATLARMFDPFFTTRPTGTGIGLAITRNIVEGLGGTIRASSQPGAGTEITLDLPRCASSDQGPTP